MKTHIHEIGWLEERRKWRERGVKGGDAGVSGGVGGRTGGSGGRGGGLRSRKSSNTGRVFKKSATSQGLCQK